MYDCIFWQATCHSHHRPSPTVIRHRHRRQSAGVGRASHEDARKIRRPTGEGTCRHVFAMLDSFGKSCEFACLSAGTPAQPPLPSNHKRRRKKASKAQELENGTRRLSSRAAHPCDFIYHTGRSSLPVEVTSRRSFPAGSIWSGLLGLWVVSCAVPQLHETHRE